MHRFKAARSPVWYHQNTACGPQTPRGELVRLTTLTLHNNGPELIAEALSTWCETQGIALQHIAPGKPNQNAFIECFNRTYRDEVLDAWVFTSLAEVRQVTEEWLAIYNTERPHDSLGGVPPSTFIPRPNAA